MGGVGERSSIDGFPSSLSGRHRSKWIAFLSCSASFAFDPTSFLPLLGSEPIPVIGKENRSSFTAPGSVRIFLTKSSLIIRDQISISVDQAHHSFFTSGTSLLPSTLPILFFEMQISTPGLDHVSRTISVHMAQDDSTYRGRNGIGSFHVSP
ncbi:hypothetical protein RHGRI_008084 [Rhododendron griersonianum]|uniref:Uncharacterized protein n=1 Tax=Rhododendron griersonianum TaxID=479676 RepID=A0AAV6KYZ7_9ERIC|nr:hypothetical protein RHGRI_008084 [Rhododendron griersonianum]